jgi:hypothetical protein
MPNWTKLALAFAVLASPAWAGDPPTVTSQSRTVPLTRDLSVGVESRTIYTQPNNTGGQPQQGTERGSSATTSRGLTIQYTFK